MNPFWQLIVMLWNHGNVAGLIFIAAMIGIVIFICVDGVRRGA